tara:strand:- start:1659 stop:2177 length:519 start_codon:yes stop_codon:yes gene_type:complete
MNYSYYEKFVNKNTKGRYDVVPLFGKPEVFSNLIGDLIKPFKKVKIDKVVGLDSLGFVIGSAVAFKLKKGFVAVRKGGRSPGVKGTVLKVNFKDYSKKNKVFEINKNLIKKRDRILIVDDWIESGEQMKAAIKLIEKLSGEVVGISVLRAHRTKETEVLFDKYNCKAIGVRL